MNDLEQWYWDAEIQPRLQEGYLAIARYESIKLRLADNTWYTPDFYTVSAQNGEGCFIETKGTFWHDDARAKFKIAAELYPEYTWLWVVIEGGKKARKIKKIETL